MNVRVTHGGRTLQMCAQWFAGYQCEGEGRSKISHMHLLLVQYEHALTTLILARGRAERRGNEVAEKDEKLTHSHSANYSEVVRGHSPGSGILGGPRLRAPPPMAS